MFVTAVSEVPFWLIAGRLTERFGYKKMMVVAASNGIAVDDTQHSYESTSAICISLTHGFCFVTLNYCIVHLYKCACS